MGDPVVHFEIIGTDPARLRAFYTGLFGWGFDTSGPVAASVSRPGEYGFTQPTAAAGIPGGVGGGPGLRPHVVFYIGVPDVQSTLGRVGQLGGKAVMGPERAPGRDLVVAHFTDPEGNLVGLAGPALDGDR